MIAMLIVVVGLLAGVWFTSALRRLPDADGSGIESPTISVVVPARDEAGTLPLLLASLDAASPHLHEVIVVDDGSTDATADIAAASGATVLRLDGPPPGWAGKPHACARGADLATGDLLLFLDADVRLNPDAVERLLAAHRARGGLLSVQPYHHVERPYEELSAMCNTVSMIGSAAFARWPRPSRPVAFGPCLLTSRHDYRMAGGHTAASADVAEDLALARAYDRAGLAVDCRVGFGAMEFRMYPAGVRQLIEGWSKNLAAGAGATSRAGLIAGVCFVAASATAGSTGLWVLAHAGSVSTARILGAVAMWVGVAIVFGSILRRIGRFSWMIAALHPVATAAFLVVFARSLWATVVRGEVTWRGRVIAVGSHRPD